MAVKHPRFYRPNVGRSSRSRVKNVWRKPRGIDNKKRVRKRYMGESPSIGWKGKKSERHIHPCGMKEIIVHTPSELDGVKDKAIRIASGVSKRKRKEIVNAATKMGLKVLNP